MSGATAAAVVLSHGGTRQLRRLVDRLHGLEIIIHYDRRSSDSEFLRMQRVITDAVFLQRLPTRWGSWNLVQAELNGIREALDRPAVQHVVVLTGSDYPTCSGTDLLQRMHSLHDSSAFPFFELPVAWWRGGGFPRFTRYYWTVRKRPVALPLRRQLPRGIVPCGGPQVKILARTDAQIVLDTYDSKPGLANYFRHVWIPDETFIPTVLRTCGGTGPSDDMWYIRWSSNQSGPPVLTNADWPEIAAEADRRAAEQRSPLSFIRKVDPDLSASLLDRLDRGGIG